jgi:arginine decarboxylase
VIDAARRLGIEPVVGVRAKLSSKGTGRWGDSTGDRAKFGLTIPEILTCVDQLREAGMLKSLQLLHFHIGSQISAISVIKDAIREASQIYVELSALGANMQYLDVGGGLGIDYDGSKTNFPASKNYNMQNYANDIVAEVKEACEGRQVQVPVLISESGRAIASHQSVLIFDVLGTSDVISETPAPLQEKEHLIIRNLWETYTTINVENHQEAYHDAIQFNEEAKSLFSLGYLSLTQRARAEQLYWACCQKILEISRTQDYVPDDLEDLEKSMASIYYVNLSVFQSVPDAWAIDQLFPIMPIHRLDEEPTQRAVLADLTCDSDGKIDQFIDLRDVKSVLELHPLQEAGKVSSSTTNPIQRPYILDSLAVLIRRYATYYLFGIPTPSYPTNARGYEIEQVSGDRLQKSWVTCSTMPKTWSKVSARRTEQALQENRIPWQKLKRRAAKLRAQLSYYTYLSY